MYGDPNWMEPDIDGRDANGNMVRDRDDYEYHYQHDDTYTNSNESHHEPVKQDVYWYDTLEEMVSSPEFQQQLSLALAHKDKIIRQLENELLKFLK